MEISKYGIHGISRTELNSSGFPRFIMPFELGVFFGAKKYGNKYQKRKNALIFEKTNFTYQNFISDLNGIDTHAHNNDTSIIIQGIRDWLKTSSNPAAIPGHVTKIDNFENFSSRFTCNINRLRFGKRNSYI